MPTVSHLGISRRIENEEERERLKTIVEKHRPEKGGFIVRTACEGASEEEIKSEALRKEREKEKWKSPIDSVQGLDGFLMTFGEPTEVHVGKKEDQVVLVFPQGEKVIDSSIIALSSNRWTASASGEWEERSGDIRAQFYFPKITGAKAWVTVVSSLENPVFDSRFNLLPEDLKEKISARVREKISPSGEIPKEVQEKKVPTPEDEAEDAFDDILLFKGDDFAEKRNNLVKLRSPGECYMYSSTKMREVTEQESEDEKSPSFSHDVEFYEWYLVVGARGKEDFIGDKRSSYDYYGGHEFTLLSSRRHETLTGTPEENRDNLIREECERLEEIFNHWKENTVPPKPDGKLHTLSEEEWQKRFDARWNKLKKETEEKWKVEDGQRIARAEDEWRQYDVAAEELRRARERVNQALKNADKYPFLSVPPRPSAGNIGRDPLEQIQRCTKILLDYALEIEEKLSRALEQENVIVKVAEPFVELQPVSLETEIKRLVDPDKRGEWFHPLSSNSRHTGRLSKEDKDKYNRGERVEVRCNLCPGNPTVGYLKKE
jgi:hypothetical protein